uniref:SLIT and NTRK-like protein 2 n=1 Tax=Myxine glutinosa TaxID=7769 RepID=UPI00358F6A62
MVRPYKMYEHRLGATMLSGALLLLCFSMSNTLSASTSLCQNCNCHAMRVRCESKGIKRLHQFNVGLQDGYRVFLQRNDISALNLKDLDGFRGASLLNLAQNDLQNVEDGTFRELALLKKLHLNNNLLSVITDGTFHGLYSLEYLQLNQNRLWSISSNAFSSITKLNVLHLEDNQLSSLPSGVFGSLPLNTLDLSRNNFVIPQLHGLLRHLDLRVAEVKLDENPWDCSCQALPTKRWLDNLPYAPRHKLSLVCISPESLRQSKLQDIPAKTLCASRNPAGIRVKTSTLLPTQELRLIDDKKHNPDICPSRCVCHVDMDKQIDVWCQNEDIREITSHIPRSSAFKELNLAKNRIQSVNKGDFAGLENLQFLNLAENRIFLIQDGSFGTLRKLHYLNLNGNYLNSLSPLMFQGLQSLRHLYIEGNGLDRIEPGSFSSMSSLQVLNLARNLLHTLPAGALQGTAELQRLNLAGNRLSNLPLEVLASVSHTIKNLQLQKNTWQCDCGSADMLAKLQARVHAGLLLDNATCTSPSDLIGKSLLLVRMKDAECIKGRSLDNTEPSDDDNTSVTMAVFITCLLGSVFVTGILVITTVCLMFRKCGKRNQRKNGGPSKKNTDKSAAQLMQQHNAKGNSDRANPSSQLNGQISVNPIYKPLVGKCLDNMDDEFPSQTGRMYPSLRKSQHAAQTLPSNCKLPMQEPPTGIIFTDNGLRYKNAVNPDHGQITAQLQPAEISDEYTKESNPHQ